MPEIDNEHGKNGVTMRIRTAFFAAALLAGLAAGCLEISEVRMPSRLSPGERFPVSLYVMADSDQAASGFLGVLIPADWSVEAVYYRGYSTGCLDPNRTCSAWLEFNDPAPDGCRWYGFVTDKALEGRGAYQAEFYLQPDHRSGGRRLVFAVGACDGPSGSRWEELDRREVWVQVEGDSEVIHLSWGRLKAQC